MHEEAKR